MSPKRTTKKDGKRAARPATQTADSLTKPQAVSRRKTDATTERSDMDDDLSPELAAVIDVAPYLDAVHVPSRDAVFDIPELLENILYFTGFKALLISVPRVNKHFNASVAASSCLQRVMCESFTPVAAEPADPSKHFLINDAILFDTFQFPGTMSSWYLGRCCWSSSNPQTCKGDHFLKIFFMSCFTRQGEKSATSWRKLRVLLPFDDSQICRVRFSSGAVEEFQADVTLGELYDLVQSRKEAERHGWGLYFDG